MSEALDKYIAEVTAAGVKTLAAVLPMVDDSKLAAINAIADPIERVSALHAHVLSLLPIDAATPSGAFASSGLLIACGRYVDGQEARR
jgi:hypothetical protein